MEDVKGTPNVVPNSEHHLELLGVSGFNPFAQHSSSSRSVMFGSHFSQRLVISGANERRVQSGIEKEFSKHTFSIKMPESGRIIKIIERFPRGVGNESLNFNPETLVIYENEETHEIDCFTVPYYASYHQFFGFKYSEKPTLAKIKLGEYITKDTIFADSPSVGENGSFNYGRSLNTAYMSLPATAEDGIIVSRDILDDLKFRIYETRVVEFGSSDFPLNIHGTLENYKPFPDIGDYINDTRSDGVLMLLREYNNKLAPADMSMYDLMEPDFVFDKATYVRGGNGRVVDIKVISNNNPNRMLPEQIRKHISKYEKAYLKYHQEIVDFEAKLRIQTKMKYGENNLKISPKLHALVVESLAVTNHTPEGMRHNLNLLYRKDAINEYRVEFVVEHELTPNTGFKMSDTQGSKGVICKIEEPENMPVDAAGNRADIVVDPVSTISRMNISKLYEHYFGSAARDIVHHIRNSFDTALITNSYSEFIAATSVNLYNINNNVYTKDMLLRVNPSIISHLYNHLMSLYELTCDKQYEFYKNEITSDEQVDHLLSVLNNGIYLYMPIGNNKDTVDIVATIEERFKPVWGQVKYVGNSLIESTTKSKVRIGPMYYMLLEKIADDWSSVSSGRLQHFGVLSSVVKSDKFAYPYRNSPVRTAGESETRIYSGYCGGEAIAELMDRSNSPVTQKNIIWKILNAEKPTAIKELVDRDKIPFGSTKPILLVKHILSVSGFTPKCD
jgi:DNA-directed RNA polymerase beta subunit